MSVLDYIGDSGFMPGRTKFRRLRANRKTDPNNGRFTLPDWNDPQILEFEGAFASSSSTMSADTLREQTESTATLTVPDPSADIRLHDRITAVPDDGTVWEVTGVPSHDVNAFTGWQPTLEIQLTNWKG